MGFGMGEVRSPEMVDAARRKLHRLDMDVESGAISPRAWIEAVKRLNLTVVPPPKVAEYLRSKGLR